MKPSPSFARLSRTHTQSPPLQPFSQSRPVAVSLNDEIVRSGSRPAYFQQLLFVTSSDKFLPLPPPSHQIFCVFLFLAGACVFGTIISNTNTVLTELGREATELAERMEGYQALIGSCRSQSGPAAGHRDGQQLQVRPEVAAEEGRCRPGTGGFWICQGWPTNLAVVGPATVRSEATGGSHAPR